MQSSLPRALFNVAAATVLVLSIPLIAMQFTSEVNWGPGDFALAGLLLFCSGVIYVVASRRIHSKAHRAVVAAIVVGVLAVVWAELAIGLFH